ncbi:hypothetical protein FRC96_04650 [Lujinxingia vulgaris]|uniref:Nucleotidyl transferase AbiEii/AbiGii toxin family protein n=1 Tax=Lujinxingia vulgaris TaxID=2600176 RepID=A0A5C6XFM7_9DELT|nr:hypothetical protein [Lujinxingia vulgaris]TXD41278.1 hypothetical protein FRC96_04650 [Lujinxingia vulgaris]
MTNKPQTADGYRASATQLVHQACLYLATILGDLLDDIVIVGGLVPSLLIPLESLPQGVEAHVGTQDLDLGLALALLQEERYREIAKRLRDRGFAPDVNDRGNQTFQRWVFEKDAARVTLDFLMPPVDDDAKGGKVKHLESDFAALVTPGLELAFQQFETIEITGKTLQNERTKRTVKVCGAAPFIILKALAFEGRGENKDAYDLVYVIQNHASQIEGIAKNLRKLSGSEYLQHALRILRDDFITIDGPGPLRTAHFLHGGPHDETQADVSALIQDLLGVLDADE